jgi:hypothetical protein
MCLPKAPKINTPPPPPVMEQAKTDEVVTAREDERKRLRNAVNSKSTILDQGGSSGKTLLGQ